MTESEKYFMKIHIFYSFIAFLNNTEPKTELKIEESKFELKIIDSKKFLFYLSPF